MLEGILDDGESHSETVCIDLSIGLSELQVHVVVLRQSAGRGMYHPPMLLPSALPMICDSSSIWKKIIYIYMYIVF